MLAGSIVRATGSGMGCPDWPKCFGLWVPPLTEDQLPADYKEKYKVAEGHDATFNAFQTWTEYLNRLAGALLGMVAFIALLFSLPLFREKKIYFLLTLTGVFLIGFEAWLGKTVVSSNLAPVKITTHMLVAFVIAGLFLYILKFRFTGMTKFLPFPGYLLVVALAGTLIQVISGTAVREQIDEIALALQNQNRNLWVDFLDWKFLFHRSFSLVILALNGFIFYKLRKTPLARFARLMIILIFLEIIFGVGMANWGIPAWIQPLHLIFSGGIFSTQCWILFRTR